MGREVRRVPADWQHPMNGNGQHAPLFDGYNAAVREWDEGAAKWAQGLGSDYNGGWEPLSESARGMTYAEWSGGRPKQSDYMPDWPESERTHFMMYESTTEGTPISPAFATPEELARWLADTNASAFADQGASYEGWLRVCKGGYALSAIGGPGIGLTSGVEGLKDA